jgi:UDP-glucose 6-dehydrogenase
MHKSGRGAGGHCFIKDFAAFEEIYQKMVPQDQLGLAMLDAIEKKNIALLTSTGKDLDLLKDCGLI